MEDWIHIRRRPTSQLEHRVLVYGPRLFDDWDVLKNVLDSHSPATIIHGHGRGVDFLCSLYAQIFEIDEMRFPAHWFELGALAASARNEKMFSIGKPDLVVDMRSGDDGHDLRRRAILARVTVITVEPRRARQARSVT